jgi:hypothetical protein
VTKEEILNWAGTVPLLAQRLGVSSQSVYSWFRENRIPLRSALLAERLSGGRLTVKSSDYIELEQLELLNLIMDRKLLEHKVCRRVDDED